MCASYINPSLCKELVATLPEHCTDPLYDNSYNSSTNTTDPPEPVIIYNDTTTPDDYEDEPLPILTYNQQYLHLNVSNPNFYLLFETNHVSTYQGFIGSVLICSLLGLLCELLRFLKWYITIRRRVTSNCLQLMMKDVKSLSENVTNRMDHVDDYELTMPEKISVTIFFFLHRLVQLLLAIEIMLAYHFWVVFGVCLGMSIGNLIFAGLT